MVKKSYAFFIFGIFALFFALNFLSPPQNDDWIAPFLYEYQTGDFETKFSMFQRIYYSYTLWNGRFGELLFISYVCRIPTHIFDFINAIMDTASIILFFILIFARIPKDKYDFMMLYVAILLLMPTIAFEEIFLWAAGSLNYLWAWIFVLLSIIPMRLFWGKYFNNKLNLAKITNILESNKLALGAFIAINFIAGMSNETFSVIVIFLHIVFLIFSQIKKIKLPLWYKLAIVAFIAGFCALFFSPGQNRRIIYDPVHEGVLSIAEFFALDFIDKIKRGILVLQINAEKIPKMFVLFCFGVFYFSVFKNASRFTQIAIFLVALLILTIFAMKFPLCSFMFLEICLFYWAWREKSPRIFICAMLIILWAIAVLSTIQFLTLLPRARILQTIILASIALILIDFKLKNKLAHIIFGAICAGYFAFVVISYIDFNVKYRAMVSYIESEKARFSESEMITRTVFIGNKKTTYKSYPIDIIYPKEKWSFFYPFFSPWWALSNDPQKALNKSWAWHFGILSLSIE